jgi:hypothetical protein
MGAWGDCLYDNDDALDELGALFDDMDVDQSAAALGTGVGLGTWLNAPASDATIDAVRRHPDWVAALPGPARELLERFTRDANAFADGRSRPAELTELLGSYCDGPRYDPLLSLPEGRSVIEDLASRAVEGLGARLDAASDAYEMSPAGAHLGVLLELAVAGYGSPDRTRIAEWRRAVDRIDRNTSEERDFWDGYLARFRRGLSLLDGRAG